MQHRFGSPNELTAIFYLTIAIDFFKEILSSHYNQDFEEIITQFTPEKDLAVFLLRKPHDESELENLKKLSKVHPLGALLAVMAYLESKLAIFNQDTGLDQEMKFRPPWTYLSTRYLERFGVVVPAEIVAQMEDLRRLRNLAAHGRKDPNREDVIRSINTVERYEKFLDTLDKNKIRQSATVYFEEKRKAENHEQQLELIKS